MPREYRPLPPIASLPDEPLYRAPGFVALEPISIPLSAHSSVASNASCYRRSLNSLNRRNALVHEYQGRRCRIAYSPPTEWGCQSCSSSPDDLFLRERKRPDRPRGTDLAAVIAARFAPSPIRVYARGPKAFEALFKAHWLQNIIWTGLEAFTTANAGLKKLFLRQTSWRANRILIAGSRTRLNPGSNGAGREHSR